ncbi:MULTISPECIES: hypothetical protein [unclassified Streptomyces]|uniref:hypothetical protein n=1 Tax=unclassified Streptomyces TaxID=2593676 RepID=UPI00109E381E|nr:hypothetical protein [Streptomyces sp. A1136]THA57645.1 hypothetical protein E6R62_07335 [Streptomyces sp. A1136]
MTDRHLTLPHTSPVQVPVFDALRDRDHPGAVLRHLVPDPLERAREHGASAVAPDLREALAGAQGRVWVTAPRSGP